MRFRFAAALSLLGTALYGHAVSISSGELRVEGPAAAFELRIPMYEVPKVSDPGDTPLNQLRFGDGHRTHANCAEESGTFVCRAQYEFPELHPDTLTVECRLFKVTVPNHIHLLTAIQGSNSDQIVFDQTFTGGEIRFHPPSPAEIVARQSAAGVLRMPQGWRRPAAAALLVWALGWFGWQWRGPA